MTTTDQPTTASPITHYIPREMLLPRTLTVIAHAALEWAIEYLGETLAPRFAAAKAALTEAFVTTDNFMIPLSAEVRACLGIALEQYLTTVEFTHVYLEAAAQPKPVRDDCEDIRPTVRALLDGDFTAVASHVETALRMRLN